jgi:hypothetical protein
VSPFSPRDGTETTSSRDTSIHAILTPPPTTPSPSPLQPLARRRRRARRPQLNLLHGHGVATASSRTSTLVSPKFVLATSPPRRRMCYGTRLMLWERPGGYLCHKVSATSFRDVVTARLDHSSLRAMSRDVGTTREAVAVPLFWRLTCNDHRVQKIVELTPIRRSDARKLVTGNRKGRVVGSRARRDGTEVWRRKERAQHFLRAGVPIPPVG